MLCISVTFQKIVRLQLPIGENIMETKMKTRKPGLMKMAITVPLFMPAVVWLSSHRQTMTWTSFGKMFIASLQTKTIWDWMDLLLLPLILIGGVLLLTHSRRQMERRRAKENTSVKPRNCHGSPERRGSAGLLRPDDGPAAQGKIIKIFP